MTAEPQKDVQWADGHRLDHRHHLGVGQQALRQFRRGLLRVGKAALHHVGIGEEVQVV